MQELSSGIISLIHHIKLNEAGWQEKSIQSLIISTIGNHHNDNMPISADRIFKILTDEINPKLRRQIFDNEIEKLKSAAKIELTPTGYMLAESIYQDFKQQLSEQVYIEEKTYNFFLTLCSNYLPHLIGISIWDDFKKRLLIPIIKSIGAKTTSWISGKEEIKIEENSVFQHFICNYQSDQDGIRSVIIDFLDFKNEYVKKYILSLRDAYFFIQASSLEPQEVDEIYKSSKTQTNLRVFVDTNFLLTLLDLHDNPSNEATSYLLKLLDEIKNKVNIKFYILPLTIDEFQNLLGKFKEYLQRIKPTLNYAYAAEKNEEFSGILKKYFDRCISQKSMIDLDNYFDPYLTNFTVSIRKKGLELFNDKRLANYSTEQKVIDDLLEQTQYRLKRLKESQQLNNYTELELQYAEKRIEDKLKHDIQLWHIIQDKRPYTDSPKDISDWIVTLDYGLLSFDRYKQKIDKTVKIGVCLHPNDLISMLQFWVPRTQNFENAILGNLRLPFLFKEIDSEGEKVSLKILEALSFYAGSDEFSSEQIVEILTNNAIRQKIKPSSTVESNAELIKEEIFKKYDEASQKLKEEEHKNILLNETVSNIQTQLSELTNIVSSFIEKEQKRTEEILITYQSSKVAEITQKKKEIENQIEICKKIKEQYDDLIERAQKEFLVESNTLSVKLRTFFNKEKLNIIEKSIHDKYYNKTKVFENNARLSKLSQELESLLVPNENENIIIFCENKNAAIFNKLGFSRIHFHPETNSNSVYIKVSANPLCFGLRDRDFLSDNEISKIRKKHTNYFILDYYCYENYLYHPSNIAELNIEGLNIDDYTKEIIRQKNDKRDKVLLKLKTSRNGYEEFRIKEDGFKDSNEEAIIANIDSDEIDIFFKSFSLKDDFNKKILEQFHLTEDKLSSTNWFKEQINKLLSGIVP